VCERVRERESFHCFLPVCSDYIMPDESVSSSTVSPSPDPYLYSQLKGKALSVSLFGSCSEIMAVPYLQQVFAFTFSSAKQGENKTKTKAKTNKHQGQRTTHPNTSTKTSTKTNTNTKTKIKTKTHARRRRRRRKQENAFPFTGRDASLLSLSLSCLSCLSFVVCLDVLMS
jgi:hypothetical protein